MNILVTGANGFIGKNLVAELKNHEKYRILEIDKNSSQDELEIYCSKADFVFHLAGVNRPKNESEFMEGNHGFTQTLVDTLTKHRNACPILVTSSIQASMDNLYGESKRAGEDVIRAYGHDSGAEIFLYRLPNVFGKWCKPNYNSVVATFCNNIARELPITVSDPEVVLSLVYIDDVLNEFINVLNGVVSVEGDFCAVQCVHSVSLGKIVELLNEFKFSRKSLLVPNMTNDFTKKLYSTYLSYLPTDSFSYDLKMNIDNRGSFTEFLKSSDRGQVSVNISKPGITKGNHWHHTKNEKFLVVSGRGVIRFRNLITDEVVEYHVSGEKLQVVDIPTGYTHNIENLGDTDMITVMWANELFDPENPDTFYLEV